MWAFSLSLPFNGKCELFLLTVVQLQVWYFGLELQFHWILLLIPLCHCFEMTFVLELLAEGALSLTCDTIKACEYNKIDPKIHFTQTQKAQNLQNSS